ncbi:MAG: 30S ribosomal protein S18 [Chloroflexota bacterium]
MNTSSTQPESPAPQQAPAAQQQPAATPGPAPAPGVGAPPRPGGFGPRPAGSRPPYGRRPAPGGERRPGGGGGRRFFARRKVCAFCVDHIKAIDYKDAGKLRRFISDRGKIEPRRKTGNCAKHQRLLAVALKRARHLALLPYTPEHIHAMSGAGTA